MEETMTEYTSPWVAVTKGDPTEARPHVPGEDMTNVRVGNQQLLPGGYIVRHSNEPKHQWFVNGDYFDRVYQRVEK